MNTVFIYDKTKKISPVLRKAVGPPAHLYYQHDEQKGEGFAIPGAFETDMDKYYVRVSDELVIEKDTLNLTTHVEGLMVTVSGLPDGSLISVNEMSATPESEALSIEFDLPGTYTIEIEPPVQYLAQTLEVTVNDDA